MASIQIKGAEIYPGENRTVEIEIARLPSGTIIHMQVHVFRSVNPGPTVLFSAGLHGDEINGVETIRRLVDEEMFQNLKCGTVIAIPIINVYGFLNFSREVPDGKDINRYFPGSQDGSLAALVAHTITTDILPIIDFGVDFHTGGASRSNYPQIRFAKEDNKGAELAYAFKAPFSMYSSLIEGSLRSAAASKGKTIVVYEGGESMRFDYFAIEEAIKGAKRVLSFYGMMEDSPESYEEHFFSHSQWVRADAAGLFVYRKSAGQPVTKGEILGSIHSPYNAYTIHINSPIDGYIISHNNFPLVHRGDAIFHLGTESEFPKVPSKA